MSSPKVIQKLWDGLQGDDAAKRTVYQLLFENSWHSSIVVSLGALLGGVAMIYVVQHSRPVKAQSLFFVILGGFLIITGATFRPFLDKGTGIRWALVIFYFICNFFFNLGANATTFIVSLGLAFSKGSSIQTCPIDSATDPRRTIPNRVSLHLQRLIGG